MIWIAIFWFYGVELVGVCRVVCVCLGLGFVLPDFVGGLIAWYLIVRDLLLQGWWACGWLVVLGAFDIVGWGFDCVWVCWCVLVGCVAYWL